MGSKDFLIQLHSQLHSSNSLSSYTSAHLCFQLFWVSHQNEWAIPIFIKISWFLKLLWNMNLSIKIIHWGSYCTPAVNLPIWLTNQAVLGISSAAREKSKGIKILARKPKAMSLLLLCMRQVKSLRLGVQQSKGQCKITAAKVQEKMNVEDSFVWFWKKHYFYWKFRTREWWYCSSTWKVWWAISQTHNSIILGRYSAKNHVIISAADIFEIHSNLIAIHTNLFFSRTGKIPKAPMPYWVQYAHDLISRILDMH